MRKCILSFALLFLPILAEAQTIPNASGVTTTSDQGGTYYTFSFPGYAKYSLGDGLQSQSFGCSVTPKQDTTSCQGVNSYYDLKNDSSALWNFGAGDTGMFETEWHLQNNGGADRDHGEVKEGPMAVTVTESNNVRVVLTQTAKVWSFGDGGGTYGQDCCVTMTKTYVFYRHGGAGVGTGASKVYTKVTLNYDGTDGHSPLTIVTANPYAKVGYEVITGQLGATGCDSHIAFTLSPWNEVYNTNNYILFAPVAKNSTTAGQFLPANTCVSPNGSFTGPEGDGGQPSPGTIYNCVNPTQSGCGSQTVNSAIVRANYLQVPNVAGGTCTLNNMNLDTYFYGGLRQYCNSSTGAGTLNTNSPLSWFAVGWIGDNSITTDATATPYVTEYITPPTMTPTNATGGAFDAQNGYWTLGRTSDNVSISANGLLHSPAWFISNWSATSAGLNVGGTGKTLGTDFVAVKTDSTHLLIQYLADVASSTTVTFSPASSGSPVISPGTPVVNQGKTLTFTEVGGDAGTWSCSGCVGSINSSTGVYTAPATVTSQASYGGYQVLPNNHIYNTRIDSVSVDSNSASWIAGAGTVPLTYFPMTRPNYVDNTTPTLSMVFQFTSFSNGPFQIPQDTANTSPFMECGWLKPQLSGGSHIGGNGFCDRHWWTIDTTTGTFQEGYFLFNAGSVGGSTDTKANCPSAGLSTCTAVSGVRYANSSYTLPAGASTDAAGLYIMPLTLRAQEFEQALATGGTINHALRFTLQNGFICNSSIANACGENATGTRHIWPATSEAFAGGGSIPYGARARLKASFNCTFKNGSSGATFSAGAKILCLQLQQYGIILADGGTGWQVSTELEHSPTFDSATNEMRIAALAPSNFEFVNEQSLLITSTSGETTNNRETVTFTRTSDSATASVDVVLQGVTVGLSSDNINIQAGMTAQQLTAYVHGGSANTVTWSMSPTVGSLTSGGIYTPPVTVASPTSTTVTATSTDNVNIAAAMTVLVLPAAAIRLTTDQTGQYTDTQGNIWYPNLQAISSENGYTFSNGGTFPGTPDITLYKIPFYSTAGDSTLNFIVPNGTYRVTGKFLDNTTGTTCTVGQYVTSIEVQRTISRFEQDVCSLAGGENLPLDFVASNIQVTNNHLVYVLRNMGSLPITVSTGQPFVSALSIISGGSSEALVGPMTMKSGVQKQ